ncbi:MAG: hypothetical protein LLF98_02795 [Clostridium sp.]|uniref:hypothetical protein n=1 Tax=Clostridium sp. TaxID=1506 RepID=UPI0025BBB39B|nr:hypothetical protein [Clostridium sp.]MCE5220212.1 hypothetical protein [Clostridium sp.]
MRERLYEIFANKSQFLLDDETIILVKDGNMIANWNDGEALCEVNGVIDERLKLFLDWLYDPNQY